MPSMDGERDVYERSDTEQPNRCLASLKTTPHSSHSSPAQQAASPPASAGDSTSPFSFGTRVTPSVYTVW